MKKAAEVIQMVGDPKLKLDHLSFKVDDKNGAIYMWADFDRRGFKITEGSMGGEKGYNFLVVEFRGRMEWEIRYPSRFGHLFSRTLKRQAEWAAFEDQAVEKMFDQNMECAAFKGWF